jgi:maltose O-acetyltransferase
LTEKEKMLRGDLYYADEPALTRDRLHAKDLCQRFNQLLPSLEEQGQEILRELLGSTPEQFAIVAPFWCDYGYNIEIGEHFFANHNTVILDCAKVRFGKNVFVAPNCGFYTAGHPLDAKTRNQGLEYAKPITVGDDVWIGGGVQVMPGVTIGSNVVIGGGSVVVKDIPSNCVAVGNPCHVIRTLPPVEDAEQDS